MALSKFFGLFKYEYWSWWASGDVLPLGSLSLYINWLASQQAETITDDSLLRIAQEAKGGGQ